MKRCKIKAYNSDSELFRAAADLFISEALKAIHERGKFSVALSGGSTPIPLYALLSSVEYRSKADWKRIHFFWCDERCVPKDHPDSNFKLAYDLLLSNLPVPEQNIHRIHGELEAADAAGLYETELSNYFGESIYPTFDLIFLGVGSDGHTASIFPELNIEAFSSRKVIAVHVMKLNSNRVSLNLPVLNNAATIAFLATGKSKAPILREILENNNAAYPAAQVEPQSGNLFWFLDTDAASLLSSR